MFFHCTGIIFYFYLHSIFSFIVFYILPENLHIWGGWTTPWSLGMVWSPFQFFFFFGHLRMVPANPKPTILEWLGHPVSTFFFPPRIYRGNFILLNNFYGSFCLFVNIGRTLTISFSFSFFSLGTLTFDNRTVIWSGYVNFSLKNDLYYDHNLQRSNNQE